MLTRKSAIIAGQGRPAPSRFEALVSADALQIRIYRIIEQRQKPTRVWVGATRRIDVGRPVLSSSGLREKGAGSL